MAGTYGDVPDTVHDSLPAVERTVLVLLRSGRCHALHDIVALHVVGQQCSTYLGYKTVRQVSTVRPTTNERINFVREQTRVKISIYYCYYFLMNFPL